MMCLKYHPDKNHAPDAHTRFQEINEAYQYLSSGAGADALGGNAAQPPVGVTYIQIFLQFFKHIIKRPETMACVSQIAEGCYARAIEIFENMEVSQMIYLYEILHKYKSILYVAEKIFTKMEEHIQNKTQYVILNPTIDNLFDGDLYRLKLDGREYLVPLWHHELVYDGGVGVATAGATAEEEEEGEDSRARARARAHDITVKCMPELPEHLMLDEYNNIYVMISTDVENIMDKEQLEFYLGEKMFFIPCNKILFRKSQLLMLKGCGIIRINQTNIYDVSKRSNIIIHLRLSVGGGDGSGSEN
jgi:hypothetical protein